MVDSLNISCQLSMPGGGWFELEDEDRGYGLHDDTLAERQTTHRTIDAPGQWVDGTFTSRATKENITETLSFWVDGDGSHFQFATRLAGVKALLDQVSWQVKFTIEDCQELWTCPRPADYTETYDKAYRFATLGLIRASVQRLPAVVLTQVAS